jgi:hypothetical protein
MVVSGAPNNIAYPFIFIFAQYSSYSHSLLMSCAAVKIVNWPVSETCIHVQLYKNFELLSDL